MEQIYIPTERLELLKEDRKMRALLEKICDCSVSVGSDEFVEIRGTPYAEFVAKNIIFAFGRGFNVEVARLLLNEEYYFSSIDLKEVLGGEKKVSRIKARIIGEDGRAKRYIEGVSAVKMSVYGYTVSFIGNTNEINEAETAVNTLIEGGTHKLAYLRMEAAHRKNKSNASNPKF